MQLENCAISKAGKLLPGSRVFPCVQGVIFFIDDDDGLRGNYLSLVVLLSHNTPLPSTLSRRPPDGRKQSTSPMMIERICFQFILFVLCVVTGVLFSISYIVIVIVLVSSLYRSSFEGIYMYIIYLYIYIRQKFETERATIILKY